MRKTIGILAAVAAICFGTASHAASCSTLTSSTSYGSFTSCTVSGGGPSGQDNFTNVSAIVDALFMDEGISIVAGSSYAPGGGGVGSEFGTSEMGVGNGRDGFEVAESALGLSSYTFNSLPMGTLFVSIKAGNGFELFGLGGLSTPVTLTRSVTKNVSHISTFGGPLVTTPLPAAALLLVGGIAGLGVMSRRKARKAA